MESEGSEGKGGAGEACDDVAAGVLLGNTRRLSAMDPCMPWHALAMTLGFHNQSARSLHGFTAALAILAHIPPLLYLETRAPLSLGVLG